MSEPEEQERAVSKPKKSGGTRTAVVAVVVIVLLGGAGGGAWWWASRASAAPAEDAGESKAEKTHATEGGGLVPLQPFLVNLADQDASRFLRCTLTLVVSDEAMAAKITAGKGESVVAQRLRSAVLELLTTQTADALVTPDGKQKLKLSILAKANALLGEGEATDVLFSEFVVQF